MLSIANKYFTSILNCTSTSKVFILDDITITYISGILSHSELLRYNIHLTMNINNPRINVLGLDAIFFIQPTEININFLVNELLEPKYNLYYLFFSNILSKKYIKQLAKADVKKRVVAIQEKFLDYYPINNNSIILSTNIIDSLSAVILSQRTSPIIRYQKNSEQCVTIANSLIQKLESQKALFNYPCTSTLLLVDRTVDLISPLVHSLSYQSLLYDLLYMNNNLITIGNIKYSLVGDTFYEKNRLKFWPDVVENMHLEVKELTKIENEIKNNANRFICEFNEFEKLKFEITKHVAIISEITRIITQNKLQLIYNLECQIINGENPNISNIIDDPEISQQCKNRLIKLTTVTNSSSLTKFTSFVNSIFDKSIEYAPNIKNIIQKINGNTVDNEYYPILSNINKIRTKNNIIVCFVDGISVSELMIIDKSVLVVGSHIIYNKN